MADKPKELTTEQLLIELGRVVMGLGTKIDSLGEKLDAIHGTLSQAPAAGEGDAQVQSIDLSPVLEKLEAINTSISQSGSPAGEDGSEHPGLDLSPLLEKLDSINALLSEHRVSSADEGAAAAPEVDLAPIIDKLEELKQTFTDSFAGLIADRKEAEGDRVDLSPVIGKLEEIREAMADSTVPEELKESVKALAATVEEKADSLGKGIDSVKKAAEDRKFVKSMTESIDKVREALESSSERTLEAVGALPGKLDEMSGEFTGSVRELKEKTSEVLERADESLSKTEAAMDQVREELEKGLKLNTDMTGQMVELTSRFADRAESDRVSELNSRAVDHFNRGEFSEADSLLREALELQPENPELLCNSANVLSATEDLKGAEKLFRKALEVAPDLEPALSGLGMVMVRTDRAEETVNFLKGTILSGSPSVRTTIAYTRALAALERHDEAVEILENALKGAPEDPEIIEELEKYGFRKE